MSRVISEENPLAEMSELKLYIDGKSGGSPASAVKLRVDARFGKGEFQAGKTVFSLAIKRAFLQLDLSGLEIKAGSRHAEPQKASASARKSSQTDEVITKSKIAGKAAGGVNAAMVPQASLGISAEHSREHISKSKSTITATDEEFQVKARGGDMWEFSSERTSLNTTIFNNQTVCSLVVKKGSNHKEVTGKINVYARDMKLEIIEGGLFASINAEKLIATAMAKAISQHQADYRGKICISRCVLEVDDEG